MPPSTEPLKKKPMFTRVHGAAAVVSAVLGIVAVIRPELGLALYPLATLIFGAGVIPRMGDR